MGKNNYKIKKGQVWVETVTYILIALVLIGVVYSFASKAIEQQKDKRILESYIDALNSLDNVIDEVRKAGPGNKREFSFVVNDKSEGKFVVNPWDGTSGNNISFEIKKSAYAASEVGRGIHDDRGIDVEIPATNLKVRTDEVGEEGKRGTLYDVKIWREFDENKFKLQFEGEVERGELSKSSTPYKLIIENLGKEISGISPDVVRININVLR
ncbi:MAG: hypothetical protein U9Q06_03180 [Nanoarchaeota archaeon]|nr:hypothetical protein [Nanoarchaeota archaeon]